MLRRTWLIFTLALGLLAAPLPVEAQKAGKVYRIGWLGATSPTPKATQIIGAFRQGLRELGYVEGQNLTIEYRWAEGKYDRLPDLATELVRLSVDLIVAPTTPAALAAKRATETIPIVFMLVLDPVGTGLVASFARPGGNLTGLTLFPGAEMVAKHLELLKETVPHASRVAVLLNPAHPHSALVLKDTKVAARVLGVQLQILEARDPDEFDSAFAAMTRERADALLVLPDAMFWLRRTRLADLAEKSRLPTMHGLRQHVEVGDLMAYAASITDLFRRTAVYVDRILKGAKPADLPVEQPMRFELIINLATAKTLGLTIPDSVLFRADELIE